jgi:hypothetical protein
MSRLLAYPSPTHPLEPVEPRPKKLAVVSFVDKAFYLWGVYSIHNQLKKFNMTPAVQQVVLVASDMEHKNKELLVEWLGAQNVREIDKSFVRNHVPNGIWGAVFSKIEFFNMTDFDKVIALDNDVFIRKNIMHWFDYPTPAATQERATLEYNSGAMVIEPNAKLYATLLEHIPKTQPWVSENDNGKTDTWNSGIGHQGFLSSFFLSDATNDTMFTMSYGSSVLSSDLDKQKKNHYFWRYRPQAIDTIHFTIHKPWKARTATNSPVLCAVLGDWKESVSSAPKEQLKPLPDFLRDCPMVKTEKKYEKKGKSMVLPL